MDKRIKKRPKDFLKVYETLRKENRLSVNAIKNHYGIASHGVINRWLSEEGLTIEKSNRKKEELIDLSSFQSDSKSGNYNIGDLAKKYGISRRDVYKIIERNNIKNTSFVAEGFCPSIEEFIEVAKQSSSRKDIAKKYQTTLAVIINFIKRNKIEKEIISIFEPISPAELIYELDKNPKHTLGSLAKKVNLNGSVVSRILSKNQIEMPRNQFDIWEEEYRYVVNQIDIFVGLNKDCGKTLKEISDDYSISIEHLKKAFKETNNPVVLHSYNKSKGELEIKEFIQSFGIDCYSTKKFYNGKWYEIDCFIPDLNLGIEFCGEYWHSTTTGTPKNYHRDKLIWCNEQGIELITIFQHEWYQKQKIIKSMIQHKIGKTPYKIFARNTEIAEIDSHTAREFHENNHINGYINSKINIGLKNKKNGELVSVFSISKSRFDKTCEYEITRFSTLLNHHVVGGLSKFVKYAKGFGTILTYVDLRFGSGKSYKLSGFETVYTIGQPNYFYFNNKSPTARFQSRISFQKHKLKSIFPEIYENHLTEKEIMEKAGYLQIYDCGNSKLRLIE